VVTWFVGGGRLCLIASSIFIPLFVAASLLGLLVLCSWRDGGAVKDWDSFFEITPSGAAELAGYKGKKIPMEVACEAFFRW
jgi:hypothetical protein